MRVLPYLIIAYILYRLIKMVLKRLVLTNMVSQGSVGYNNTKVPQTPGEDLSSAHETTLDPVCDSYIPKEGAMSATRGGECFYFCGNECREKFLKEK